MTNENLTGEKCEQGKIELLGKIVNNLALSSFKNSLV